MISEVAENKGKNVGSGERVAYIKGVLTCRGTVSRRDFAFIDPSPLPVGSRARARSRRVDRAHLLRVGAEAASTLTMTQTPTGEAAVYRFDRLTPPRAE